MKKGTNTTPFDRRRSIHRRNSGTERQLLSFGISLNLPTPKPVPAPKPLFAVGSTFLSGKVTVTAIETNIYTGEHCYRLTAFDGRKSLLTQGELWGRLVRSFIPTLPLLPAPAVQVALGIAA